MGSRAKAEALPVNLPRQSRRVWANGPRRTTENQERAGIRLQNHYTTAGFKYQSNLTFRIILLWH